MRPIHPGYRAPVKSMLLASLIGLGSLPAPATADTAPQWYGFCWAKAPPATAQAAVLTNYTTLVFAYDRWQLDEGRFVQAQFESMALSTLGLSMPKDQLVCEKEGTPDKAMALRQERIRQFFAAAGPATAQFLDWVPPARPLNAVAVPAPAPSQANTMAAAPQQASTVGAGAAPSQRPSSDTLAGLGELAVDEQVNLAYFRESSCQQLAETRQSQAQKAREMDAEWAENARSRPSARKRNNWEWGRQEMAEMFRRSAVILESVRTEKGCS
jgi:hypothetical protein